MKNINSKRSKLLIEGVVGPYLNYCDGFGSPGAKGNNYILGFVLGVGKTPVYMSHEGSEVLDGINAFDKAEVSDCNIGQINMTIVSSFCGVAGLVWGYDIARPKELYTPVPRLKQVELEGDRAEVYSLSPLLKATKALFGTVQEKRFPLIPGSHVPCAGKNIKARGPKRIYCALAMGIPENREENAILLMEDMGHIPYKFIGKDLNYYRTMILNKVAKSILYVGKNQNVKFKEIFVDMKDLYLTSTEIGCVIVAAPYFTLAQNALPNGNPDELINNNLSAWTNLVKQNFIDRQHKC